MRDLKMSNFQNRIAIKYVMLIGLSYERPYLVLALNLILFFVYAVRIPR